MEENAESSEKPSYPRGVMRTTSLPSFLIGFSFSPTAEISSLELEFEESLPRKTASKRGLDRSQMEQPIKKNNCLTLPDLAFGFVHKRSGNEIRPEIKITPAKGSYALSHINWHKIYIKTKG